MLFYLRASKLAHAPAGPSAATTHGHKPSFVLLATGERLKDGIERYCPLGALERLNKDGMEFYCPLGTLERLNKDRTERYCPLRALERLNKDRMELYCPLGTLESINKDKIELPGALRHVWRQF